jgi:tetratricopeptide (TPR) repeat protein
LQKIYTKLSGDAMKKLLLIAILVLIQSCSTESWETLRPKTEDALNNKNYAEALEYLEEALSSEPQNAEIHYYLGQTYRMLLFADGSIINNVNIPYASKSTEYFLKAIEISPKYEGKKFVVDPYSKIQSIWGSVAMTYLYRDNPDSAEWALKHGQTKGGFYPAIMEYNKNIMASCEKNAILFTNGDNDTYPMWFLQLIERYRTDITVINLSLLNVSWYIKQLKNSYPFGENNLFLTLTDQEIDNLKAELWQEKIVEIPVKHDPLNEKGKIEWIVKPTVDDKAIRVQDLMLIEIINSNKWNRPVYFSTTVYEGNKIGLDEYLILEGLVYKIYSHLEKPSTEKLYSNLSAVYTYDGVNDKHIEYVEELQNLYQNYRHCFITLSSLYNESGQKEKAIEVLNLMKNKLPENLLPFTNQKLKKEAEELQNKVLQ